MKRCSGCKLNLSLDSFNNQSSSKDGKNGYCRTCHRRIVREWREKNPEKVRQDAKKYYDRNRSRNAGREPDLTATKRCTACKQLKLGSEFYVDRGTYDILSRSCRQCGAAAALASYHRYPDQKRERHIRNRYGITLERFNEMLQRQGGGCAVCGETEKMVVDHCHATGKVRGALCIRCNTGLGGFRDRADLLRRAIEYLGV